jgi:hypothetical protein
VSASSRTKIADGTSVPIHGRRALSTANTGRRVGPVTTRPADTCAEVGTPGGVKLKKSALTAPTTAAVSRWASAAARVLVGARPTAAAPALRAATQAPGAVRSTFTAHRPCSSLSGTTNRAWTTPGASVSARPAAPAGITGTARAGRAARGSGGRARGSEGGGAGDGGEDDGRRDVTIGRAGGGSIPAGGSGT